MSFTDNGEQTNQAPLVSVILLCYMQQDYVKEAVQSLLNQDYENIEYIFSDDCSSDETFNIISNEVESDEYKNRVFLNKNKTNLGLVPHFNYVLSLTKGDIIVVAAGDDISLPDRVTKTVSILNRKDISFVSFNDEVIDTKGKTLSVGQRVQCDDLRTLDISDYLSGINPGFSGASRGFKREVYDVFGDLNVDCPTEDTPYILRGLLLGNGAVSPDIAIKYRRHNSNLSGDDLIQKMSVDSIFSQYEKDVGVAKKLGFVDDDDLSEFIEWHKSNLQKRKIVQRYQKCRFDYKVYFCNILFSSKFSSREKYAFLKKCNFWNR
ncbi:glycosyltransferase [Vibrio splendidus]|uniref:glycosyltransferase n=1 Tax=Vibrio splendidus TaxID=29497 RepID=UPI001FB224AB|nr:glycosyltransferase [Vibrio splendidus]UOE85839.1 glycosyltransferase [Vibrio splendidus]